MDFDRLADAVEAANLGDEYARQEGGMVYNMLRDYLASGILTYAEAKYQVSGLEETVMKKKYPAHVYGQHPETGEFVIRPIEDPLCDRLKNCVFSSNPETGEIQGTSYFMGSAWRSAKSVLLSAMKRGLPIAERGKTELQRAKKEYDEAALPTPSLEGIVANMLAKVYAKYKQEGINASQFIDDVVVAAHKITEGK